MKTISYIQAPPDFGTGLSSDEIKLISDYRSLRDRDREAVAIFAEIRKAENPRKAELRLVSGGSR